MTPKPWFRPFVERRALGVAVVLLALACGRIISTYDVSATTNDETGHFAGGLDYLVNHSFKLETQHPPLTRAMIALLPYLNGTRPQGFNHFRQEGWALMTYQHHPERTLFLMRLGNLPFFVLGGLVVFFWARRYLTPLIAVLATLLYTLLTPLLAHGGLATTDMGLAACTGAAFLALLVWAERPTYKNGLLLGVATALAVLSKFTALGYLPAAAFLALLCYLAVERPAPGHLAGLVRQRALSFAVAAATCILIWWAAYFFTWGRTPNLSADVPAPAFFDGIKDALKHNREGHGAFLFGQHSMLGWWYYFPVAIGVKTPLAFLLLLAGGVALIWKNRRRLAYLLPLAFSLGVLLPAMTGHVNIGVRHVLPVYVGFSIVAAIALAELIESAAVRKWTGALAGVLVLWLVSTGILHHPDYIPYFNELIQHPEEALLDSDYDWGQDTKRLAARLRELGATSVNYGIPLAYDEPYLEAFPGLPRITGIDPTRPAEGWTAVQPTLHRTVQYGMEYRYPGFRPWFEFIQPVERVGTLTLYYVPPGTLKKLPK